MPDVRASDADRERAATALRDHCAAGRLTVDELEERLSAAYAARTERELRMLFHDPPESVAPAPVEKPRRNGRRRRRLPPGRRWFTYHDDLPADPATVRLEALEHIAPMLSSYGYRLVSRRSDSLAFEVTRRPGWTILLAIFGFPFGLLALLHVEHDRIDLGFEPLPRGRTRVVADGVAPRGIRQAFAELND